MEKGGGGGGSGGGGGGGGGEGRDESHWMVLGGMYVHDQTTSSMDGSIWVDTSRSHLSPTRTNNRQAPPSRREGRFLGINRVTI